MDFLSYIRGAMNLYTNMLISRYFIGEQGYFLVSKINQKETVNLVSQAGQSIFLLPGFLFILSLLSHPGQVTSTLGTFGWTVKLALHEAH
tara:strand:+ start:15140 stop:15409 length:270 start_codon:yes stop_codon:yes gene_type:complete